MKCPTPKLIKTSFILLLTFSLSLCVFTVIDTGKWLQPVYSALAFSLLLFVLYILYVTQMRWMETHTAAVKSQLEAIKTQIEPLTANSKNILSEFNVLKDRIENSKADTLNTINSTETKYMDKETLLHNFNGLSQAMENLLKKELARQFDSDTKLLRGEFINLNKQLQYTYDRMDALFSIHQLIHIRHPLPIMHDWTIPSDFAHHLLQVILSKTSGNVLDVGSGISTILSGYAVELRGGGKVISLEHDQKYAEKTYSMIKAHRLENFIELYYCPIVDYTINEKKWSWYDISAVKNITEIEVVCIDGPPGSLHELARYPALPLLHQYLTKSATILLDDGARIDEKAIAEKWIVEFNLEYEYLPGFKGISKFNMGKSNP